MIRFDIFDSLWSLQTYLLNLWMYHVHVHHKIPIKGGKCLHFDIHIHDNINTFTSCVQKKGYPSSNLRFQSQGPDLGTSCRNNFRWTNSSLIGPMYGIFTYINGWFVFEWKLNIVVKGLPVPCILWVMKSMVGSWPESLAILLVTIPKSLNAFAFKWQSPTSWPTYRVLSLAKSRVHGDDWATFPHFFFGSNILEEYTQRVNLPQITVSTRHDLCEWCMSHIYNTSEGTFQSDLSRVCFINFLLNTHTTWADLTLTK